MEKPLREVIVVSENNLKLMAVEVACARLSMPVTVSSCKPVSHGHAQPYGMSGTISYAFTRARECRIQYPHHLIVAIENGIVNVSFGSDCRLALDLAAIVIICEDGREIITTSPAIEMPMAAVNTASERGFNTVTVGSVVAEMAAVNGKVRDPADPHAIVTDGKVRRRNTLIAGLEIALMQV